jgi:hypothetical protein
VFDKDAGLSGENNSLPAIGLPRAPSEMVEDPDKHAADGDGIMTYIKDKLMLLIPQYMFSAYTTFLIHCSRISG